MIELPDDELDKLFRKSSEELDPTYEPADWSALKKRLDQEDGTAPVGWLRKWWSAGLLLLLVSAGLGGYYFLEGTWKPGNAMVTKSAGPKKATAQASPAARNDVAPGDAHEVQAAGALDGSASEMKVRESVSSTGAAENRKTKISESDIEKVGGTYPGKSEDSKILPRSRSKAGGVYLEPNRSKGKGGYGAFSSVQKNTRRGSSVKVGGTQKMGKGNFTASVKTHAAAGENPGYFQSRNSVVGLAEGDPGMVEGVVPDPLTKAADDDIGRISYAVNKLEHSLFKDKAVLVLPNIETPEMKEMPALGKARDLSPKMAIRVGYSPDLSTVGLKNFSKPGSSFSILVEYGLLPRLYVQAGLVRSVKDYYAKAADYELSKYVTQINTPYGIDGTCRMLEIPLGVRYDLLQKDRFRLFAGTGFTSYYIQNEKYVYHYEKYVHLQKSGWEGKTGWYWLSHINASVGYEQRISNKLSILAEPYIRIPLKGVGYGKVNLVTTGMWLSVRYTPYFFK